MPKKITEFEVNRLLLLALCLCSSLFARTFVAAETTSTPNCSSYLTTSAVLKDLYDSTGGPTWANSSLWLTTSNINTNATCTWYGITCDKTKATITKIALASNNLTGTLPWSLSCLPNLTSLDARNNSLRGTLSASFSSWTKLTALNVATNQLSGELPVEYSSWGSISTFTVSTNRLNGTIPAAYSAWGTRLKFFAAATNSFSGTLPAKFSNWTSVTSFNVAINNINGSIPNEYGAWGKITKFVAYTNSLTGTLPASFSNWSAISYFHVAANQLNGTLPPEYALWSGAIQTFYVQRNQISGTLSSTYSKWTSIATFYAYTNSLCGTLPSAYGNWSKMSRFYVTTNQINGTLPPSYANWTNSLIYFNVGVNRISGSLPQEYSRWTNVTYFGVYNNNISGTIPTSYSQWSALDTLVLRNNALVGSIPPTLSNMSSLRLVYVNNNSLSGTLHTNLSTWSRLTYFVAYLNKFTGTIPSSFSNLTSLTYFHVALNNLSGTLPTSLGRWGGAMKTFAAYNNTFNGTLPDEYANWTSLTYFNVGINRLNGTLPKSYANWSLVKYFHVGTNNIFGTLPREYGFAWGASISTFIVGSNALSGTLPWSYGNWSVLTAIFDASYNYFSGNIPLSYANMTRPLLVLSLQHNCLSGFAPAEVLNAFTWTKAANSTSSGGSSSGSGGSSSSGSHGGSGSQGSDVSGDSSGSSNNGGNVPTVSRSIVRSTVSKSLSATPSNTPSNTTSNTTAKDNTIVESSIHDSHAIRLCNVEDTASSNNYTAMTISTKSLYLNHNPRLYGTLQLYQPPNTTTASSNNNIVTTAVTTFSVCCTHVAFHQSLWEVLSCNNMNETGLSSRAASLLTQCGSRISDAGGEAYDRCGFRTTSASLSPKRSDEVTESTSFSWQQSRTVPMSTPSRSTSPTIAVTRSSQGISSLSLSFMNLSPTLSMSCLNDFWIASVALISPSAVVNSTALSNQSLIILGNASSTILSLVIINCSTVTDAEPSSSEAANSTKWRCNLQTASARPTSLPVTLIVAASIPFGWTLAASKSLNATTKVVVTTQKNQQQHDQPNMTIEVSAQLKVLPLSGGGLTIVSLEASCVGGKTMLVDFSVRWPEDDVAATLTKAAEATVAAATAGTVLLSSASPGGAVSIAVLALMSCNKSPPLSTVTYLVSVFFGLGATAVAAGNLGLIAAFTLVHVAVTLAVAARAATQQEQYELADSSKTSVVEPWSCGRSTLSDVSNISRGRFPSFSITAASMLLPGCVLGLSANLAASSSTEATTSGGAVAVSVLVLVGAIALIVLLQVVTRIVVLPRVQYAPYPTGLATSGLVSRVLLPEARWEPEEMHQAFKPLIAPVRDGCTVVVLMELLLSCSIGAVAGAFIGGVCESALLPIVGALHLVFGAALIVLRPHRLPMDKVCCPVIYLLLGVVCALQHATQVQNADADSGLRSTSGTLQQIVAMLQLWRSVITLCVSSLLESPIRAQLTAVPDQHKTLGSLLQESNDTDAGDEEMLSRRDRTTKEIAATGNDATVAARAELNAALSELNISFWDDEGNAIVSLPPAGDANRETDDNDDEGDDQFHFGGAAGYFHFTSLK